MAEHSSDYTPGQMDVHQQEASFRAFVGMAKWGSLHIAVALVFLVLMFCTNTGFLGSVIPALVVLVLGVLFLRKKPGH